MTIGSSIVVLVLTMLAPAARAQTAEAEVLFREGKRLLKAGEIAAACEKFEASERLEPENGTELNLADCWERIGRTASAWAMFVKAAGSAKREDRAAEARRRADLLKDQLVHLTIEVPAEAEVDDLEITRNDQAVDRALWNESVPVDPDEYTITAHAPRRETWSTTIKIKSKDKVVVVPKLERAAGRKRTPKAVEGDPPNRYRGATIAFAVSSAGAIAIATGFAFHSKSLQNRSDEICPGTACNDTGAVDLNRRARNEALFANIGWALGGAAAVAAIITWSIGAKQPDRSIAVTPAVTDDGAGVVFGGRF
jgi:hypothetical protein